MLTASKWRKPKAGGGGGLPQLQRRRKRNGSTGGSGEEAGCLRYLKAGGGSENRLENLAEMQSTAL